MFKSVSFNIFEENLEEIVYRKDFEAQENKNVQPEKAGEKNTRQTTEVIIKPLSERHIDPYGKMA